MESSTKDTLSKRLVQLRTERGWTQSDLVEKMYLSQRTISHIEKGDCTLSNLIQLADLYDVSADYLLGRSAERRFITLGLDPLTTDIIEQLTPIVPIWVSCLYFCVLIIVLVILCYIFVWRFNYDNLTEIAY
ncbi:MAG: helix-turn-helix domain-containing protein [Ruminiclostridium sp.]